MSRFGVTIANSEGAQKQRSAGIANTEGAQKQTSAGIASSTVQFGYLVSLG